MWIWHVSWNKIIKKDLAKESTFYFDNISHINMHEDLLYSTLLYLLIYDKPKISSIDYFGIRYLRHKDSSTLNKDFQIVRKNIYDTVLVLNIIENFVNIFLKNNSYLVGFKKTKTIIYFEILNKICSWKFSFNDIYLNYKIKEYLKKNFLLLKHEKAKMDKFYLLSAKHLINELITNNINEACIYGTGEFAKYLYNRLNSTTIRINCFVQTDVADNGVFLNKPILTINEAMTNGFKNFVITSFDSYEQIKTEISKIAKTLKKTVYCFGII